MSATTVTMSPPVVTDDSVDRRRLGIVFIALVVCVIASIIGGVLWPSAKGEWFTYAEIAPIRTKWWALASSLGIVVIISVPAQAIATLSLVRRRGATWATSGAVVMWVGASLQAVGAAGWAMTYYFVTNTSYLPAPAGTTLLDHVKDDSHLFALAMPGTALVSLGTIIQGVALLRAHVMPKWVPIVAMITAVTSIILPYAGPLSLLTTVPFGAAVVAIGYYAWQRAGSAA